MGATQIISTKNLTSSINTPYEKTSKRGNGKTLKRYTETEDYKRWQIHIRLNKILYVSNPSSVLFWHMKR